MVKVKDFSVSLALLLLTLFSTTSSQKLSPLQSPLPSPPTQTPSGMNTVPLVPVSPAGAPITSTPKTPTLDITQILTKAKRFTVLLRLLKTTQLINQLNSQLISSTSAGLTLFAPEDTAFTKLKPGFLNSLNDRQKVELLQFHTLSSFISISNFDTLTNPVQTQAGDDSQRLQLNVTTYGGNRVSMAITMYGVKNEYCFDQKLCTLFPLIMATGAVNATVTGTVYVDNKLGIYQVDKVLLPLDLVLPKAQAPSPANGVSPKSGETGSSAGESGKNGSGDDAVQVNASSAGLMVKKVVWMMRIVLALVHGVTI